MVDDVNDLDFSKDRRCCKAASGNEIVVDKKVCRCCCR